MPEKIASLRRVRSEQRERAPREREADVAVETAAEQLEVVSGDENRPDDDEWPQDRPNPRDTQHADPDRNGKPGNRGDDEHAVRDVSGEWMSMELVQRVGRDPRGLASAREAVATYYGGHGAQVGLDDLVLTTTTSESRKRLPGVWK